MFLLNLIDTKWCTGWNACICVLFYRAHLFGPWFCSMSISHRLLLPHTYKTRQITPRKIFLLLFCLKWRWFSLCILLLYIFCWCTYYLIMSTTIKTYLTEHISFVPSTPATVQFPPWTSSLIFIPYMLKPLQITPKNCSLELYCHMTSLFQHMTSTASHFEKGRHIFFSCKSSQVGPCSMLCCFTGSTFKTILGEMIRFHFS